MIKICANPICGKKFEVKANNQKYCCTKCRKRMNRIKERKNPPEHDDNQMGIPIREFECRYCGKTITVTQQNDHRTVFCCAEHERKYWKHPERYNKHRFTDNNGLSGGMSLHSLIKREKMDLA